MLMKWKIYRIPKILSLTGIITLENMRTHTFSFGLGVCSCWLWLHEIGDIQITTGMNDRRWRRLTVMQIYDIRFQSGDAGDVHIVRVYMRRAENVSKYATVLQPLTAFGQRGKVHEYIGARNNTQRIYSSWEFYSNRLDRICNGIFYQTPSQMEIIQLETDI